MPEITEMNAIPDEGCYVPERISLNRETGSVRDGVLRERDIIIIRGGFVRDSFITERKFLGQVTTSQAGGDICPAVEEMMWVLLSRVAGRGFVYFTPGSATFNGDVQEVERFLEVYGLTLITIGGKRTGDEFMIPLYARNHLQGVIKLWNGHTAIWPFVDFRILVPKPSRFEVILDEARSMARTRTRYRTKEQAKVVQNWGIESTYIIEDPSEGERNQFCIYSAEQRELTQAKECIEEIWRSYGVHVET